MTTDELLAKLKDTEKALKEAMDVVDNQKAEIDFLKEQLRRNRGRGAASAQSSSNA
jgi:hypothetical protein